MDIVEKLFTEWAWRSKNGIPSIDNPEDKALLDLILEEMLDEAKLLHQDIPVGSEFTYEYQGDTYKGKTTGPTVGDKVPAEVTRVRDGWNNPGKKDLNILKSYGVKFTTPEGAEFNPFEKVSKPSVQKKKDTSGGTYDDYLVDILQRAEVSADEIQAIFSNPNFQTAKDIQDFVDNAGVYMKAFENIKDKKGGASGRGELIPLVSIKGARLGGYREIDIQAGNKTLEVKELGVDGSFRTASAGNVLGTAYQKNKEMFIKYLREFDEQGKFENTIRYFEEHPTEAPPTQLKELKRAVQETRKMLTQQKRKSYIKIGGKSYYGAPGETYTISFDEKGYISGTTLPTLERSDYIISKLQEHPWIDSDREDPILDDLNEIKQTFLGKIDYLLLYLKDGSYSILHIDRKKENEDLPVYLVTSSSLKLKYIPLS